MLFVPQQFPNISSLRVWFFFGKFYSPILTLDSFLKKQEVLQHTAIPAHLAEEHKRASVH